MAQTVGDKPQNTEEVLARLRVRAREILGHSRAAEIEAELAAAASEISAVLRHPLEPEDGP